MDTPYFSVIVPMYNVEKYIKICIDSILAQTFKNFEVIIIDDCSTDNSYKICQELYGNNEKVKLFRHEKNLGQGSARNFGLKNARGEYIWFIDSDDAIIPNALEKLQKVTETNSDVDVVHIKGWLETTQNDDKPLDINNVYIKWENNNNVGFVSNDIQRRLYENWIVTPIRLSTWTKIHRLNFLKENKIKFPDAHIYWEDNLLHLSEMVLSKKFFMLKDAVYIYRMRPESSGHKADIMMGIKSMAVLMNEMKKVLDETSSLNDKRLFKEHIIIKTWEKILNSLVRPLYNGVNIPSELDKEVYEAMLPIFGENTTMAKYLFHGYNNMWRQANILAQQNYLLRQREDLIDQQNKLIEHLQQLLEQYNTFRQ